MQFSLFGVEAGVLTLADLDGVLLGGGQWLAGPTGSRLSVVVDAPWRAVALHDAFESLQVGPTDPPGDDGTVARTAMTPALRSLEARWRHGAVTAPPTDLVLSAGGLRLWAITAGRRDDVGYVLRTPERPAAEGDAGRLHRIAGAVLARTGIAAVELGARGGPGWRVTSARRLRRLAELIGPPPPGGEADWPPVEWGGAGRTSYRH